MGLLVLLYWLIRVLVIEETFRKFSEELEMSN